MSGSEALRAVEEDDGRKGPRTSGAIHLSAELQHGVTDEIREAMLGGEWGAGSGHQGQHERQDRRARAA
jgi:hypothetical protein